MKINIPKTIRITVDEVLRQVNYVNEIKLVYVKISIALRMHLIDFGLRQEKGRLKGTLYDQRKNWQLHATKGPDIDLNKMQQAQTCPKMGHETCRSQSMLDHTKSFTQIRRERSKVKVKNKS